MIHLPASVRVYLCLTACDMRKSFDSLHGLVRDYLELNDYAGHLFVFASWRRDRIKILYWDRDGEDKRREITAQELGALLSGIDLGAA